MDTTNDENIIVYPFSFDREGFIQWFRENFYNLKQNPEANNYIKIYYKCLSSTEKANDMIIDSIRYLRKSNERDKEIANYKNIIDSYKNKNSNLENANNQLKNILAYMRCSVRDDIEKTHCICKTKAGKQAKSLRNAYQVMVTNVNKKTVDINTNLNFFLKEMNLILDDKWITEFFEQYKTWACDNIDNLFKKFDEETLRDINLYREKINQKMSVSKASPRTTDISNTSSSNINCHGDNNVNDGVFKKPADLPPGKSLKKISSIVDSKEFETDLNLFKIPSRQSINRNFLIDNIPPLDNQSDKSENRSHIIDATNDTGSKPVEKIDRTPNSGSSESLLGGNKEIVSDDKPSNLSSIMEVSEPSGDESAHNPTPPILSLSLAIDQIEKNPNDFFRSCKPVAESTVKPNKSTEEIENIDFAIDMDYFNKKGPVAESTKKPAPLPHDNHNHRNIVDSFNLPDIQKLRPMAESTKKVPEKKSEPLDESLSITVLNKFGPVAESTKKVDYKSTIKQDEIEANSKSMKQSSKEIKINPKSSVESEYPIKRLQEKKSELLDESITMTTFKKFGPVAESTKKIDINSNNNLIVKQEEIEINRKKPIDFAIDMEYLMKKGPVAESTKKPVEPIESKPPLLFSDFLKSRPVAESTKKVPVEPVETVLQLKSLPLTDINKRTQISKLVKLPNENNRPISTNTDYDNNNEGKENLSENNVECTTMNLNQNSEDKFNKTQFFITENKMLISDNLKIFPKSPWEPEIRSQLWKKCLQILKGYPDVYIIDQEISLRNKITFRTGDQYHDYYLSSASKLKSDKFVDVFVTEQCGGTGKYVVKILNSKESIEYYVIKYIQDLINKKPSKIVDIAPSICNVFNLLLTSSKSVILMPYYNKGSLLDLSMMIKKENIKTCDTELIAAFIAIELLLTVFYLHNTANILHCDIKPDNVMLNEYFPTLLHDFQLIQTRVITIIDFGKAIFLNHFGSYSAFVARGSPKGLECVEMVANKPWRYQIDLFNIATTLYILLQSRYPQVVQKENRYVFSSFTNFRNLRAGSLWLNLFDKLINIESDNYPQISVFLKGFTDLINSNINEYNRVADSVNKLLRMRAPL